MRGSRASFILAALSVVAAAAFTMVDPVILRIALDSALGGKPVEAPAWFRALSAFLGGPEAFASSVALCAAAMLTLNLAQGAFLFLKGWLSSRAAEGTAWKLRTSLFRRLSALPHGYFARADSGDLIQRCTSDVDTVRRFLESQVADLAKALFLVLLSVAVMSSLDLRMSAVTLALVPVIFLWSLLFFRRVQKHFLLADEAEAELSSVINENLHGFRVIKAFAREDWERERFDRKNHAYAETTRRLIRLLGTYWSVSAGLSMLQMAAILIAGSWWAARGEISMGTVVMFFAYAGRFLWPVRQMGRILTEFGKSSVALERMGAILSEPTEYEEDGSLEPELSGRIEFQGVSFRYGEGEEVLKDLSFSVEPGQTLAILGRTGSGKSSLVQLLARFADPTGGRILLDGTDIRKISKRSLRAQVGMVLQESFLFSRSMEDNLRLGSQEADREDLEAAARMACLSGVVADFEKGWETAVGEEGVTLSGGQRQRAAIARVLLRKPRILILDDSLSAVDTETDATIRAELGARRGRMTVIVIAHRLTTLASADSILVLEDGRVADQGTHEELLGRDGLYRSLWSVQADLESAVEPREAV